MNIKKITGAAAATVAAAGSAAVLGKAVAGMKSKEFCPICSAKRLMNKARLYEGARENYGNGVAMTPPMGWSSWNLFATKINENLIKEIALAMKNSGLADAGYQYVNIDDCWQASTRDENGKLQCDRATFPGGIESLVKYVNSLGLKLGIYSSNGTHTCEDYPASLKYEATDADTFAKWGVEYFKYDFCHNVPISEKAPKVTLVEISKLGETAFATYKPSQLTLKGSARIVKDDNKKSDSGEYIVGICSRNGSFSLEVDAPQAGRYALTLTVVKDNECEKFICATVNESQEYHIYSNKVRASDGYRRIQTVITLDEGHNSIEFANPVGSKSDSAAIQYKLMGRELKRATKEYAEKNNLPEKPIVFSICEWGFRRPWKWGREAGNLWRTTPDIRANWASVMSIYEVNVRLAKYSCVGGWNDPDMLEVGNGNLTYEENKSHFSLWCMMCAPLILGNDIRKFIKEDGSVDTENKVYQILTNKAMIAVNQDKLGVQCRRIKMGAVDILVKPLENAKAAVCVLNKTAKEKDVPVDFKKISDQGILNLPCKDSYKIYDVWEDTCTDDVNFVNAHVAAHGVKVYIAE